MPRPSRTKRPKAPDPFPAICKAAGLPEPRKEFRFHPLRLWRVDYYFPEFGLAVEKEGGFVPNQFLLADYGYSTYSTTIEAMQDTIDKRPQVVQCFVDGSAKGWYNYLYGDNKAANEMIKKDNPDITDYYGYGDIRAIYRWRGNSFSLMGRGNIDTKTDLGAHKVEITAPGYETVTRTIESRIFRTTAPGELPSNRYGSDPRTRLYRATSRSTAGRASFFARMATVPPAPPPVIFAPSTPFSGPSWRATAPIRTVASLARPQSVYA